MLPPVIVSVLPLLLLRVVPLGRLLRVTAARLLLSPESPLTARPRLRGMAWPTLPATADGATVGASGLTVTASLAGALVALVLSVTCTESEKLASLGGVSDTPA